MVISCVNMDKPARQLMIFSKKVAKYGLSLMQGALALVMRKLGIIDFRLPPYTDRIRTGGNSIRDYYESGLKTYAPIATMALAEGVELDEGARVLDFGCGVARQLLHFTRYYPKCEFYACDVSESAVKFIKDEYPEVKAYVNNFQPPLQYEDGFFELVYSVSIFTHLNLEDHDRWLAELSRITRIGGLCMVTTEGHSALRIVRAQRPTVWGGVNDTSLDSEGFIYREYPDFALEKKLEGRLPAGSKFVGIDSTYGNMFISPKYIRERYPAFGFEIVAIVPGIIGQRQDLVVLRRV